MHRQSIGNECSDFSGYCDDENSGAEDDLSDFSDEDNGKFIFMLLLIFITSHFLHF